MTHPFRNRAIVVSGATGIAAAAALALADLGANVFTMSIDEDECRALHADMPNDRHDWASVDLRDEAATVAAFDRCTERFGAIDGIVAVAGGSGRRFGDGRLDTVSLDAWTATLDLNLTTTFLTVREGIKRMLATGDGGSIVVISSVLAEHPSPELFGTQAYAVAKGAQATLVRTAASAYASEGIRINAVAPSVVTTPMSTRAQQDEAVTDFIERKQPLSRGFLEPEAVASAAIYLLSDAAASITGQVLTVDGGWSVTDATT